MDRLAKEKLAIAKARAKEKAGIKVRKLKSLQAKKKKKQRKLGFLMGVGSTCLVFGGYLFMTFPLIDYMRGKYLFRQKAYLQAAEAFDKCGDFINSASRRQEAFYAYAEDALERKEYQSAYHAFVWCGAYRDSADRAKKLCESGLAQK